MWYTGQFYALFFLLITLKLDFLAAYTLIGISLLIGTPLFIFFGWLSDRIGRLKIIMAGCLIAAVSYFWLFGLLTHYVNPDLEAFQAKTKITVTADPANCNFHIFVGPWSKFTECDRAQDFLTKSGLSFTSVKGEAGKPVVVAIGDKRLEGFDAKEGVPKLAAALKEAGYAATADLAKVNWFMAELILVIFLVYVTMVYGRSRPSWSSCSRPTSATPRCRCPITSATAGSAACCRCWRPRWSPGRATSTTASGTRSAWRS